MQLKNIKSRLMVSAAALTMVGSMMAGMPVHAAGTATASGAGLQSETQTYTTTEGKDGALTGAWNAASNDGEAGGAGQIQIVYDTTGGSWQDPGADASDSKDNGVHDNGTYVVTIPKKISYENMSIGTVKTEDSYTVNVRGAIASGKKVTLTAETSKTLATANGDTGLTETTTQGKTEWTTDQCFGSLNSDGSLSGTNATDKIALSGTAKASGHYVGTVQYTASVN